LPRKAVSVSSKEIAPDKLELFTALKNAFSPTVDMRCSMKTGVRKNFKLASIFLLFYAGRGSSVVDWRAVAAQWRAAGRRRAGGGGQGGGGVEQVTLEDSNDEEF
jgi:hypothetical protein